MAGVWVRSFLIVALCGLLLPALLGQDRADHGSDRRAIYLAGLVVIAVGGALLEIRFSRRPGGATESSGDAEQR